MTRRVAAIHQPNYLPWPGYFNKIYNADVFIILDTVDFQSGNAFSVTNRARIKSPQGEMLLTQPVKRDNNKIIKDIVFDNTQPWRKKHLISLQQYYGKAPAFSTFYPILESLFEDETLSLSAFNTRLITSLCTYLDIDTPILLASHLDIYHEDKNERLIALCQKVEANVYLSGLGARSYNNQNLFAQNGIELVYNHYTGKPYTQQFGDFVPYLSIIDVIFNLDKDARTLVAQ